MPQEPLFSLVIPTRNRAHLLKDALQSALEQTFDDYELVVSDNCSVDDTAEVIREIGGGRVRYVKPDTSLPMPEHWDFALDQARGRYVGFLADDDALASNALARISQLIESSQSRLLALYSGIYYASNWLDPKLRNVAVFAPYGGAVREHSSSETIRKLFGSCQVVYEAPRMLNTFCHRETMLQARAVAGKLFLSTCPDYSFSVTMLTQVPTWHYLDEPLHLVGVVPEGIGSTQVFNRGEAVREYLREFKEDVNLRRVPLRLSLLANYITETLLITQERLPALAGYEVDWVQYFLSCWNDLLFLERNGVDVSADREEFARVLASQRAGIKERVDVILGCGEGEDPLAAWNLKHPIRAWTRKMIDKSPLVAKFESVVRGRNGHRGMTEGVSPANSREHVFVDGAAAGFTNILECARLLPGLAADAEARNTPSKAVAAANGD